MKFKKKNLFIHNIYVKCVKAYLKYAFECFIKKGRENCSCKSGDFHWLIKLKETSLLEGESVSSQCVVNILTYLATVHQCSSRNVSC